MRLGVDAATTQGQDVEGTLNGIAFNTRLFEEGASIRPFVGGTVSAGLGTVFFEVGTSNNGLTSGEVSYEIRF